MKEIKTKPVSRGLKIFASLSFLFFWWFLLFGQCVKEMNIRGRSDFLMTIIFIISLIVLLLGLQVIWTLKVTDYDYYLNKNKEGKNVN